LTGTVNSIPLFHAFQRFEVVNSTGAYLYLFDRAGYLVGSPNSVFYGNSQNNMQIFRNFFGTFWTNYFSVFSRACLYFPVTRWIQMPIL